MTGNFLTLLLPVAALGLGALVVSALSRTLERIPVRVRHEEQEITSIDETR